VRIHALRAAARIAWREARRAPGRSLLVAATVGVPVAVLTLALAVVRAADMTPERFVAAAMGTADLRLAMLPEGVDPGALRDVLPAGSRVATTRVSSRTLVAGGRQVHVSLAEPSVAIGKRPIGGSYVLLRGRAPRRPGEAAVDPSVLDLFRVRLGGTLSLGDLRLRVVGIAMDPTYAWEPLVVVAPGTLADAHLGTILVDLPDGADPRRVRRAILDRLESLAREGDRPDDVTIPGGRRPVRLEGFAIVVTREEVARQRSGASEARGRTGVAFGGATLGLLATGVVAAAAFAVGVRRRLRTLGILGAVGGEPWLMRAVVLLEGTVLGLLASAAGVAVGAAAAPALAPYFPRLLHRLPGPVALPGAGALGAIVLGTIAATVAAAWPARVASRLATLDALAARMPPPRPPGPLARRGLLVSLVGLVATGVGARPGADRELLVVGLPLTLGGLLLAVPWLTAIAGRLAPRLPAASRVALRDAARNSRRTGAAVAAAAVALALPVAVGSLTLSEEAFQRRTAPIGARHILVAQATSGDELRAPPPEAVERILELLPGAIAPEARPALLDPRRYPPPGDPPSRRRRPARSSGPVSATVVVPEEHVGPVGTEVVTVGEPLFIGIGEPLFIGIGEPLFIGGPELLRALDAADGIPALEAGKVVSMGRGPADLAVVYLRTGTAGEPPSVTDLRGSDPPPGTIPLAAAGAGRRDYSALPALVIAPEAAARLGLLPAPSEPGPRLVAAPRPLTADQVRRIREAAAAFPLVYVQTLDDFVPHLRPARLAAVAGAGAIALAIVGLAVALTAAEARRDMAILVAVGASPWTRRRMAAARAGVTTLLAAALALPAGFLPIAVLQWSRVAVLGGASVRHPVIVPWAAMALVALGAPLVAAALGGLASREPRAPALLQAAA
jgi:putative ABC transport system permease protein